MTEVTVKALRSRGGLISWTFDNPQQCARFWKELCNEGCAPDTGESLESAAYFLGENMMPKKRWSRVSEINKLCRRIQKRLITHYKSIGLI